MAGQRKRFCWSTVTTSKCIIGKTRLTDTLGLDCLVCHITEDIIGRWRSPSTNRRNNRSSIVIGNEELEKGGQNRTGRTLPKFYIFSGSWRKVEPQLVPNPNAPE